MCQASGASRTAMAQHTMRAPRLNRQNLRATLARDDPGNHRDHAREIAAQELLERLLLTLISAWPTGPMLDPSMARRNAMPGGGAL
jgi:hypothetical protein